MTLELRPFDLWRLARLMALLIAALDLRFSEPIMLRYFFRRFSNWSCT